MAQDIEGLIPDGAKKDLEQIDDLWADILAKTIAYVDTVSKLNNTSGVDRTLSSLEDNVHSLSDAYKQYVKGLDDVTAAQKRAADAALKAAKTKTEESKQALNNAKAKNEEAKATQNNEKAKNDEAKAAERVAKAKEKLEKARVKEEKNLAKLNNAYERLKAKYNETADESKRLGAELGIEDQRYKDVTAEANRYYAQLLQLEQAVGQNQRRVGAYTDATNELTQIFRELPSFTYSVQTGLLGISNNFGPLTDRIQTLIRETGSTRAAFRSILSSLLSFNVISSVVIGLLTIFGDELFSFGKKAETAAEEIKLFAEEQKKLNEGIANEVTELTRLRTIAEDTRLSYKERGKAVDELQDKFPEYFGNLSREKILNGQVQESYSALTDEIVRRARITAAADNLEKEIVKLEELKRTLEDVKKGGTFIYDGNLNSLKEEIKLQEERIKKAEQGLSMANQLNQFAGLYFADDDVRKAYEAAQAKAKAEALLTEEQRKELKKREKNQTDLTNTEVDTQERINKALSKQRQLALNAEIEYQQNIADNEEHALQKRMDAHVRMVNAQLSLNEELRATELENIEVNLAEIAEIEKKAEADRTPAQKKLLAQKAAFEEEKNAIVSEYLIKELGIITEGEKQKRSILKSELNEQQRARLEYVEQTEKLNHELAQEEIDALTKQFADGKMSTERYHIEVNRIKAKYGRKSLDESIAFLEEELKNSNLTGEARTAIEEKLAAMRVKSDELANQEIIENREKLNAKLKELGNELYNAAIAVYKGISQGNINEIEQQQKAAEKKKEQDLLDLEAATISDEEKAAKKISIEKGYQAQLAQFEEKKKEEQRKTAEFEKRLAYSRALIEGTADIAASLDNLPMLATKTAILFAKLATIASAPIPGYFGGTDNAKPGLAWVSERGQEGLIDNAGNFSLLPSIPTLHIFEGGETVIPHEMLSRFLTPQLKMTYDPEKGRSQSDSYNRILLRTMHDQNAILRQIRDRKHVVNKDSWKPYVNSQIFK